MSDRALRARVELVGDAPDLTGAAVHLYVEDTTEADASADVVYHVVVPATPGPDGALELVVDLGGVALDGRRAYAVRVLVDRDGDGRTSQGDYVSTVSHPLPRALPEEVVVPVRLVPRR